MSEQQFSIQPELDTSRLQVEVHRRLISQETREMTGILEYADRSTGKRVLTIPVLSEQAAMHTILQRKRIPVYKQLAVDNINVLLDVPNDARTIESNLKFISRDIEGYSEIFAQIGEVLGRCAVGGVGLPDKRIERSILEGIVFSNDKAAVYGGNVHLVPPYSFTNDITKAGELSLLRDELLESQYLSAPKADALIEATRVGWERVRQ